MKPPRVALFILNLFAVFAACGQPPAGSVDVSTGWKLQIGDETRLPKPDRPGPI